MSVSRWNKGRISTVCFAAFAFSASGWLSGATVAQEFCVSTKVYRLTGSPGTGGKGRDTDKPVIIARSLTLFQAGVVYDYVDPADEVVLFDVGNRRFTLLNTSIKLTTVVTFDELEQLLRKSRTITEKYLNKLKGTNDRKAIAALRFQLNPRFKEYVDSANKQLTLSSSTLGYEVECAAPEVPEVVDTYLRYTDWTAKLNHILHPQAMLPGPRIALDSRLRERKWLPVTVELSADSGTPLLRASHRFYWTLNSKDRNLINSWKTMLRDRGTRRVSFREYQRVVLSTVSTDR
jgi:hypothetical protein